MFQVLNSYTWLMATVLDSVQNTAVIAESPTEQCCLRPLILSTYLSSLS